MGLPPVMGREPYDCAFFKMYVDSTDLCNIVDSAL